MRKIMIIATLVLVTLAMPVKANLPTGIANAFRAGSAEEVARYFEPTLEMSITGTRSMYSKVQAKQVLGDFFASNKPRNLVEKHNGGRGNSQFSVFTFSGGNEKYRTTIFYKGNGEAARISQITIEKDSGL